MITFSQDPEVAERQMQAIIFYLTTFGYIDGDFDQSEKDYVRTYIRGLVEQRVKTGVPDADEKLHAELVERFATHFNEVFENIDREVQELFTESVSAEDSQEAFISTRLKLRCFELFQSFDRGNQETLLEAMDALIAADGQVHPAEQKFRNELVALFESDLGIEIVNENAKPRVTMTESEVGFAPGSSHPFFDQFEHHYSSEKDKITGQVNADLELVQSMLNELTRQRELGAGKLYDRHSVAEFAGEAPFLDGHTWVHPTVPGTKYELLVLGDLHGCYSCLKGAVMQTTFFDKVAAYRADNSLPKPMLILLGDYIDRGLFSLNGVLRTVLQLFVTAPDHVYVLRGNHEYYVEHKGQIYGGVKPAEAINTLRPHLPIEVFRQYMKLFNEMPNVLLFGEIMFVHAGIPRDRALKEKWKDLASLNDGDLRFQMMWSDPSSADVIPAALQEQSARFPFGRLQATAFLQRIGCHTLIRGHEKVNEGFHTNYNDDGITLCTLFSAGGDNADLPEDSSYRTVTPKALTIQIGGPDGIELQPFPIDYRTYNDPTFNGFFASPVEIEHRA
jgi:hypothetical protein